jgi:hypothetical protein
MASRSLTSPAPDPGLGGAEGDTPSMLATWGRYSRRKRRACWRPVAGRSGSPGRLRSCSRRSVLADIADHLVQGRPVRVPAVPCGDGYGVSNPVDGASASDHHHPSSGGALAGVVARRQQPGVPRRRRCAFPIAACAAPPLVLVASTPGSRIPGRWPGRTPGRAAAPGSWGRPSWAARFPLPLPRPSRPGRTARDLRVGRLPIPAMLRVCGGQSDLGARPQ